MFKTLNKLVQSSSGSVLLPIIIIMPAALIIVASTMQLTVTSIRIAKGDEFGTHAQLASDAGLDVTINQINQDSTHVGTVSEVELMNTGDLRTTYQTTVTDNGDSEKIVRSTGRTYRPASATTPVRDKTIEVSLRAIRSSGFSIVTGVGGLYLSNSAKILGGDVFVNGEINMSNSSQIGLSTNPIKLSVAHQNCPDPPDATYPRICGDSESGQPINMTNSAHIYGDVYANNQTDGSDMTDGGLQFGDGDPSDDSDGDPSNDDVVDPLPLPIHDRTAQKDAVTTTRTGSSASCTSNGGTETWAANTKITGDVEISKKCEVTVEGNVWITGNFTMENSGELIIKDGLTTEPDIMVDGQTTNFKNSSKIVNNNNDKGARIITYWSKASCSPDCDPITDPVSGQDLYDSRNEVTIELDNSAEGPGTIFYSRWTRVLISNSGQIGALIGQTVELKNSGTITFGASAGGGGDAYWVVDGYRRVF